MLTEVRAASQLDQPNILQVYDLGKYDGWLYSVTELCDEDMNTWCLRHGWMDVLARIIEAGEGLARLHELEIIHGDIKPANILIKNGVAKLGDFGMVSAPGQTSTVVGTPGFIAPEVATGHRSTAGDVFALAATAWSCLFGGLPFGQPPPNADANAATAVFVQRALDGEFAVPLRTRAGMPQLVMDVIQHGLHWDHEERPSLEDWLGQLRLILESTRRLAQLRARVPGWRSMVVAASCLLVFGVGVSYLAPRADDDAGVVDEQKSTEPPPPFASPRMRAEAAARAGDGDDAVMAISQAWERFDDLSPDEQIKTADAATKVAKQLDEQGQYEPAQLVWHFAARLHQRLGQIENAEEAFEALTPTARLRSK